jgi:predicted SnoaL-like aldol condensation-catalyzing enzyme
MIRAGIAMAGIMLLAMPVTARRAEETERNRTIVMRFADILYREKDVRRAFNDFVVSDYVQHNPGIADGRAAAVASLEPLFSTPGATFVVKRIVVDGDLAIIHLFGRGDPATAGGAVADIYRLKDGKIVEHWDVIQPMPKSSKNPHPMF